MPHHFGSSASGSGCVAFGGNLRSNKVEMHVTDYIAGAASHLRQFVGRRLGVRRACGARVLRAPQTARGCSPSTVAFVLQCLEARTPSHSGAARLMPESKLREDGFGLSLK